MRLSLPFPLHVWFLHRISARRSLAIAARAELRRLLSVEPVIPGPDDCLQIAVAVGFNADDCDQLPPIRGITRARYPHRSEWREPKIAKPRSRKRKPLTLTTSTPTIRHSKTGAIVALNYDHARRYAHSVVRRQLDWSGIQPAWSPDRIADLAEDCCHEALSRWISGESRAASALKAIASAIRMRIRAMTGVASEHRQKLEIEHAPSSPIGVDAMRQELASKLARAGTINPVSRDWADAFIQNGPLPGRADRMPQYVRRELTALLRD